MRRIARRWFRTPQNVTFCERCAEACTPACRSEARFDRVRTAAMAAALPR